MRVLIHWSGMALCVFAAAVLAAKTEGCSMTAKAKPFAMTRRPQWVGDPAGDLAGHRDEGMP
jgi:hypothetical protein